MTSSVPKMLSQLRWFTPTGQSDLNIMAGPEWMTLRCRRSDNHPLSSGICLMSCCRVNHGHGD